jgi:hypothetical protein
MDTFFWIFWHVLKDLHPYKSNLKSLDAQSVNLPIFNKKEVLQEVQHNCDHGIT